MNMPIGVDETFGVIHSWETIPANPHDMTQAEHLLHGPEASFWGDAGSLGVDTRGALAGRKIDGNLAARPGKRKQMNELEWRLEKTKASVRAKVEHPLRRIKQPFGYRKVRYRGLENNNNRRHVRAAFFNLLTCKNVLLASDYCVQILLKQAEPGVIER